jgi:hypothetical protein
MPVVDLTVPITSESDIGGGGGEEDGDHDEESGSQESSERGETKKNKNRAA